MKKEAWEFDDMNSAEKIDYLLDRCKQLDSIIESLDEKYLQARQDANEWGRRLRELEAFWR